MKRYWQIFGVAAIVAGIVYYPAMKLIQYIRKQRAEGTEGEEKLHWKVFSPAYRGKFKPHHRHPRNSGTNLA